MPKGRAAGYIAQIARLWQAREELSLRNVRGSHLHYTLSMIFCVALADMSYSFMTVDASLWGLNSSTLMNLAYCISVSSVMLVRFKDFSWFFRLSTVLTVVGFVLWLLLPAGPLRIPAGMLCWFGLGGCAISATFAYVFILMNAERLLGILVINLMTGGFILLHEQEITGVIATYILPALLVLSIILCIFRFRPEDFPAVSVSGSRPKPVGGGALMFCFVSFFAVNIFGETMLRMDGDRTPYAVGTMLSVLLVFLIQLAFTRSVWHTWNLFLVLAAAGVLLMAVGRESTAYLYGSLIFGAATGTGYIGLLYLAGGVAKRRGSMAFIKKALLVAAIVAVAEYGAAGIMEVYFPQALPVVAPALVICLFLIFTLFSPVFFRALFIHDWLEAFHHVDVGSDADRFAHLGLSSREKQVCGLLLEGYTLRQIAAIIGIGYSTVNTYCTSLYRKLGIGSRTELFVRFGAQKTPR